MVLYHFQVIIAHLPPIKILKDTGASQSLILADILPFSEKTSSGTNVLIQGVECGNVNIPLQHVDLSSDLVTGQTDDPIEQETPDLYPSCAVTRAMAKKAILKNSNSDIDLTDTFIGQYFNNEIKKSLDPSLSDTQTRQCLVIHHHGLLTKVTTRCQSHSLSRNSKLILRFQN